MPLPVSPLAKRVLPLIDLTELGNTSTAGDALALCEKAKSLPLPVAAVCIRPAFVGTAKQALTGTKIKVATVINFPDATTSAEQVGLNIDAHGQAARAAQAVKDGADEIDLVFAWKAFQQGNRTGPKACIEQVKAASGSAKLKVIMESGAFGDMAQLREACNLAIDGGADFLKTSTGVYPVGATPEGARVLCEASRDFSRAIGVKISGGVRTGDQAREYIDLAAGVLGLYWISPDNFRIGASKLVDNLLAPPAAGTPAPKAGY